VGQNPNSWYGDFLKATGFYMLKNLSAFWHPLKTRPAGTSGNYGGKVSALKKTNLFLFSPPLLLPFANRYRFINRINQWLMSKSLKKICHQLNFRHPILLTYLPNTADLVGKLGEELLIYDCVDEHAAFLGFNADLVTRMEIDLIKQADLVFATALPLYEDKKRYTDQIHLLRNAADVEHFNKADDEATPIPEDVVHIKAPVSGVYWQD
jgi:hypothetical protein